MSIERIGKEIVAALAALMLVTIVFQLFFFIFRVPVIDTLKDIWVISLIIVLSFPLYLGFRKGV